MAEKDVPTISPLTMKNPFCLSKYKQHIPHPFPCSNICLPVVYFSWSLYSNREKDPIINFDLCPFGYEEIPGMEKFSTRWVLQSWIDFKLIQGSFNKVALFLSMVVLFKTVGRMVLFDYFILRVIIEWGTRIEVTIVISAFSV